MKIFRFLNGSFERNNITDSAGMKLYLLLYAAAWMCLGIHTIHMVAFAITGVHLYTIINGISMLCYLLMLYLCYRKRYKIATILLTVEVCLYTLIVSVTSGVESYILTYYMFVVMLQIILPYGKKKFRNIALIMILFIFVANLLYCWDISFFFIIIPAPWGPVFSITNLIVIMFGMIVCLYIDDFIQYTAAQIQQAKFEELRSVANKDALTGLYNRHYAEEALQYCIETKNTQWCVALLDIDKFKTVNDVYGHDIGDAVLVYLAEFLQTHLRSGDFVFRWGGEEFLLLLGSTSLKDCAITMDKLRLSFSAKPIEVGEIKLNITFTVGVSILDLNDIEGSIKNSDDNLYKGKESGRNKVVF